MTRQINPHGLEKLKQWEGLKTKAYKDAGGVWTIGYGHTAAAGTPAPHQGMVITEADAESILLKDLTQYEAAVENNVNVKLNDNEFAALVSFTFNVGINAFKNSSLLKKLNKGNFDAVPSELMKWVKAGGKKLQGLVNRRRAEAYLWMEGAFVASKDVVPEQKTVHPVLKPEVVGPVISAASGLTGFATGSGPFQWALAAVMVIGVAIGSFYFIKRLREAEL
ncbi:glycoside hydrolase family protein [uncultured Bartonella sp.]|uniref:lysozyme n=1 Tax=uncultured Bartonella sp. TaxID=104108 RepID=UPI0025DC3C55|nr:glycoside hydrolase family protein [uncultured Bartonella sp.]